MNYKLRKKYLGVDWGEKRIGLALGDSETKVATPFRTAGDMAELVKVVKGEEIDVVVVGRPVPISNFQFFSRAGEAQTISKQFEKFVDELKSKIYIPVELIDERLSSKAADALPGDKKTKAGRDEIAAMLILQSYLDKI